MSKVLQGESHTQDILHMNLDNDSSRKRNWGLLVTGIVGGTLVVLYAVATPFITPALRKICLPFVPATSTQIENVLKMLQYRSGSLVDIGSGDGRIVIAAAKEGFKAVGYELNPWLVWYSRYRAWREGMHHNAKFYISDLWKVSFSQYTNVVVFGVPQMMPQLEKKLEEELDHNARVVACRFPFPHWMPDHTTGEGIDVVWAYDSKAFKGNEKTLRNCAKDASFAPPTDLTEAGQEHPRLPKRPRPTSPRPASSTHRTTMTDTSHTAPSAVRKARQGDAAV
ncbi:ATP synthase subunit C lysine N-methyltransferase [Emys orbicularis]|uniref:ATP synthase subunit C lysine N-methyltransferase n=1 Tax=Emys orbicularis TaxID=82168 RepID=UPI0031FC6DC7